MRTRWLALGILGIVLVGLVAGPPAAAASESTIATFAGGCFWCMQPPFDKTDGVLSTVVGYTGGQAPNPTYEQVSDGGTGHAEAIQVVYDPAKVSYEKLLEIFWHNIDPTARDAQFCDHGRQYRAAIFYHNDEEKKVAESVKARVDKYGKWGGPVVTEIVKAGPFYKAEPEHQDYLEKSPNGYTCHFLREESILGF